MGKRPKIRFNGFTDDWEQHKLSDIADKAVDNRGKTPTISEDGTHPLLEVASLGNGTPDYSKVSKYLSDETFEDELRAYIKEGDILFSTVGSIGLVSLMDNNENAAIAQNIVAFRANEKYDAKFLYAMLSTEDNQNKAQRIVMGAVQPSIKVSQLVDVEYGVTDNKEEQCKLGGYFLNLDNLITLHQRKGDELTKLKNTMLQKMFPQKGKKQPEIRFAGFTDDWEQRKVGEFYDFKNGLNKGKDFFGTGTPIVNFTDVFHNRGLYEENLKGKVTLEPSEIKNYEVKKGDIFFTRTSETIEEIGYPSVMLDTAENTVFSGFVLRGRCYQSEDPLDDLFKKYVFFTNMFRAEMLKKSSMTTRALTSGTAIKNMEFQFPSSKEEQHSIGEYLTSLDHLITLHQRKCDHLKTLKKFMLQNMFPSGKQKGE